jgi:hypothetical protein
MRAMVSFLSLLYVLHVHVGIVIISFKSTIGDLTHFLLPNVSGSSRDLPIVTYPATIRYRIGISYQTTSYLQICRHSVPYTIHILELLFRTLFRKNVPERDTDVVSHVASFPDKTQQLDVVITVPTLGM